MKKCLTCKILKASTSFAKNSREIDNLNPYCRLCIKIYTASRKQINRKLHKDNRSLAISRLGGKCKWPGCEIDDPQMLQIDHKKNDGHLLRNSAGKRLTLKPSSILRMSTDYLFANYQLLCRNHNMKKHRIFRESQLTPYHYLTPACKKERRKTRNRYIRVYDLFNNCCQICGETDPYTFSIDHIHNDGKICRETVHRDSKRAILRQLRVYGEEYVFAHFQLACFNCNCKKEMQRRETIHASLK